MHYASVRHRGIQKPPSLWLTHHDKEKNADWKKKTPCMQGSEERVSEETKDHQEKKEKHRVTGSSNCPLPLCGNTGCMPNTELSTEMTPNHMQDTRQMSLTELTPAQRPLANISWRLNRGVTFPRKSVHYLPILCGLWTTVP